MLEEDIIGLTAEQIRDKYALPATPKYIVDVILPEGTTIRGGIANGVPGLGQGDGLRFDMMGQQIGEFINPRSID